MKNMKWYKVIVFFEDEEYHDEIKGFNEKDALKRAYWNWPDAINIKLAVS